VLFIKFRSVVMDTFLVQAMQFPIFENFKFVRVSSLVGRYFYNMLCI